MRRNPCKDSQPHIPDPKRDLIGKQLSRRAQLVSQKTLHVLNAVIDGIPVCEGGCSRFDKAAVIFYVGAECGGIACVAVR